MLVQRRHSLPLRSTSLSGYSNYGDHCAEMDRKIPIHADEELMQQCQQLASSASSSGSKGKRTEDPQRVLLGIPNEEAVLADANVPWSISGRVRPLAHL